MNDSPGDYNILLLLFMNCEILNLDLIAKYINNNIAGVNCGRVTTTLLAYPVVVCQVGYRRYI